MKSLLNAFTKKEGKKELSGARCMGISSFLLILRGSGPEGGLQSLPKLPVVPSHHGRG